MLRLKLCLVNGENGILGLAVVGYEVSDMTEVRIVVKRGIIFARRS